MTAKAIITVLIMAGLVGGIVYIAVRAMRYHVAVDNTLTDDWAAARKFGGGFGPENRPPSETIVRASWVPVHPSIRKELTGDGNEPGKREHSPQQLQRLAKWCDDQCHGGWMLVVGEGSQVTIWFEERRDAERFSTAWLPLRAT